MQMLGVLVAWRNAMCIDQPAGVEVSVCSGRDRRLGLDVGERLERMEDEANCGSKLLRR